MKVMIFVFTCLIFLCQNSYAQKELWNNYCEEQGKATKPIGSVLENSWSDWFRDVGYVGRADHKTDEGEVLRYVLREEQLLEGSRVDLSDSSKSIEVEWCHKWEQSFAQAKLYSILSQTKIPTIILLKRGPKDDEDYIRACLVRESFEKDGSHFELLVYDVTRQK